MTRISQKTPRWQKIVKRSCLPLASAIILAGCGGGYDGGALFSATPTPTASIPDPLPSPTAPPAPPPITETEGARQAEQLDRGLVAVPTSKGNIVSWRLLGNDDPAVVFDVYKNNVKLNANPLAGATFYKDIEGSPTDEYRVVALVEGAEVGSSKTVNPWANSYLGIPLNRPANGFTPLGDEYSYSANDASVADLDGDGQYEIVLKWMPSNSRDNANAGYSGNAYIDAYTLEGKQLWRIDLGRNIRAGAHYNPFIVYDFDGDGRAEMAVKTADATVDGQGTVIGDPEADYRDANGYILEGPEFLTMFDGLSGEALDTIDYNPPRGDRSNWGDRDSWGDTYGNRVDRFLAGVAYFDGLKPSLFMSRGYYQRAVIVAYDWVDGAFQQRWYFDTLDGGRSAEAYGQGNHQVSVADVDGDRYDEIIFGAATIDHNGELLYSTGLGHGDALHVGDLDPNREGIEVYGVHENPGEYRRLDPNNDEIVLYDHGSNFRDAATGEIIWSRAGGGDDIGRGVSINIDPRYPGSESWSSRNGLVAADNTQLLGGPNPYKPDDPRSQGWLPHEEPDSMNFAVWWDGDLLREMLSNTSVTKWDYANNQNYRILNASERFDAVSNNGTKATPSLSADILGDWREEIIWPKADQSMLMVFSTTAETTHRYMTLMHDSQYRLAIAWQNVGYNQPPHPSFYIGDEAAPVWQANIDTTEAGEWAKLVARGRADTVEVQMYINGFDVAGITLKRSTDPDDPAPATVATLGADERIWVDDDPLLEPGTTYYYWAELADSSATTSFELASKTALLEDNPAVYLTATLQRINTIEVALSWAITNTSLSAIEVFRSTLQDGSDRISLATLGAEATDYLDTNPDPDNINYYWLELTNSDGEKFLSSPSKGIFPASALVVEMESLADQGSFAPFVVVEDATASGGQYITCPDGDAQCDASVNNPDLSQPGYVVIPFELAEDTTVRFDIAVDLPTGTDDSFHYRFDEGGFTTQNNVFFDTGWTNLELEAGIPLSAGAHTLTIQRREAGAKLDAVALTAESGSVSLGVLPDPTPTPEPTATPEPTPTPGPGEPVVIEAESLADLPGFNDHPENQLIIEADAEYSGGEYVIWPDDPDNPGAKAIADYDLSQGAYLTVHFNLSEQTDVEFALAGDFPTDRDDSINWTIDGGAATKYEPTVGLGLSDYSVATLSDLAAGEHTLIIQVREAGSKIDTISLSPAAGVLALGGPLPPAEGISVWLEAECAILSGDNLWALTDATGEEDAASNNAYLVVPTTGVSDTSETLDAKPANMVFTVTTLVETAGDYPVYVRYITTDPASGGDDSYLLTVNGANTLIRTNVAPASTWAWSAAGTFTFNEGDNTVTLAMREDGLKVDKFFIGSAAPSGIGDVGTNCQ